MKFIRTIRGARLVHGGSVLSEVLSQPGPTHSVFDVLAAAVDLLATGPKVGLLGFAAGGMVAPLRALGCAHPLRAVDLDVSGVELFQRFCGEWAGEVSVEQGDAVKWLRGQRGRFNVLVEDLSVEIPNDVVKPQVSFDVLPSLLASRLAKSGVAIVNALPSPDLSWSQVSERIAQPWKRGWAVHFQDFENRILLFGSEASGRDLSRALRASLFRIGSELHDKVSVRSL